MKNILRSTSTVGLVGLIALAFLASTAPVQATTCTADLALQPSGPAYLQAYTDARGAVAVRVYDASGAFLQQIALVGPGIIAQVSFPVAGGQHFEVAFLNRKGTILCVHGIDIPMQPTPNGGGVETQPTSSDQPTPSGGAN